METTKLEISDKCLFEKIKKSINHMHFMECGLCGAIQVEAIEFARILNSKDPDDAILSSLIESEPIYFENSEEYEKWKNSYDRPVYDFLDRNDVYYGRYDEIIIFHDPTCNCFNKDRIDKLFY